jgi:hypothetical protein
MSEESRNLKEINLSLVNKYDKNFIGFPKVSDKLANLLRTIAEKKDPKEYNDLLENKYNYNKFYSNFVPRDLVSQIPDE